MRNWAKETKLRLDVRREVGFSRTKHAAMEKKKAKVFCEECGDRALKISDGKKLCGICFEVVAA